MLINYWNGSWISQARCLSLLEPSISNATAAQAAAPANNRSSSDSSSDDDGEAILSQVKHEKSECSSQILQFWNPVARKMNLFQDRGSTKIKSGVATSERRWTYIAFRFCHDHCSHFSRVSFESNLLKTVRRVRDLSSSLARWYCSEFASTPSSLKIFSIWSLSSRSLWILLIDCWIMLDMRPMWYSMNDLFFFFFFGLRLSTTCSFASCNSCSFRQEFWKYNQ